MHTVVAAPAVTAFPSPSGSDSWALATHDLTDAGRSALGWSAWPRLVAAAAVVGPLWWTVAWALSDAAR